MKVFNQIEQLQRIHRLVLSMHTGPPDDFAKKLGISARRLHDILDELKSMGAPIVYSHSAKSYFYSEDYHMDISIHLGKKQKNEEK